MYSTTLWYYFVTFEHEWLKPQCVGCVYIIWVFDFLAESMIFYYIDVNLSKFTLIAKFHQ